MSLAGCRNSPHPFPPVLEIDTLQKWHSLFLTCYFTGDTILCRKVLRPDRFWKPHCHSIKWTLHVGLVSGHICGHSCMPKRHVTAAVQLGTWCVALPGKCFASYQLSIPTHSYCCSCLSRGMLGSSSTSPASLSWRWRLWVPNDFKETVLNFSSTKYLVTTMCQACVRLWENKGEEDASLALNRSSGPTHLPPY